MEGATLIELDRNVILKELIPALVERHFLQHDRQITASRLPWERIIRNYRPPDLAAQNGRIDEIRMIPNVVKHPNRNSPLKEVERLSH